MLQVTSETASVSKGSSVHIHEPKILPNSNLSLQILQQSPKWIVVAKPASVHVSPNTHIETDTLLNAIVAKFPHLEIENIGESK